jgi:hypothetical protein
MNRVSKLLLVSATAAAVASAGTVFAYASWPVPSKTVKMKVRALDMPRGVEPSVARSGANAVVTWSPQEIAPGATMQSYVVKRHNADDTAVTKAFAPVTATTFMDTAVPAGKWYWTVTPKFADWTGAESRKSAIVKFTAPAATGPTALVANTDVAPMPAASKTSLPAGGGVVVTSPPAVVSTPKSPASPDPEEEPDTPAPPTAESASAEPSPSVSPAEDSK